jgi:DNA-binding CsgD family transcriptional regulator
MPVTRTLADLDRLRATASTIRAPETDLPGAEWQVAVCIALEALVNRDPALLLPPRLTVRDGVDGDQSIAMHSTSVPDTRSASARYGETEDSLLDLLFPAFRAAVADRERSRTQRAIGRVHLARLLDTESSGALLMDLDGHVVHESCGLCRLLSTDGEGEIVRRAATRQALSIVARCKAQNGAERGDVGDPAAVTATTHLRTAASTYELRATYARIANDDPLVIVTVESQGRDAVDAARVRERYDLTAREMEVVHHLLRGQRTADIARVLDLSVHTVRRHTEHILSKLGVHSRGAIAERIRGE